MWGIHHRIGGFPFFFSGYTFACGIELRRNVPWRERRLSRSRVASRLYTKERLIARFVAIWARSAALTQVIMIENATKFCTLLPLTFEALSKNMVLLPIPFDYSYDASIGITTPAEADVRVPVTANYHREVCQL